MKNIFKSRPAMKKYLPISPSNEKSSIKYIIKNFRIFYNTFDNKLDKKGHKSPLLYKPEKTECLLVTSHEKPSIKRLSATENDCQQPKTTASQAEYVGK